ncbi:MAG TPA: hypothetical protein VGE74_28110 [Gemmata sp.]
MDPRLLVTRELVESGQRLLTKLAATSVAPVGAMWARRTDRDEQSHLFIVSPLVEEKGPIAAYSVVGPIQRELNEETKDLFATLDEFAVKLLGPSNPLAKGLLAWYERHNDDQPTLHRGSVLGSVPIDGAYLYPATMFAAPATPPA